MEKLKVYIDRLKNGHVEKIEETVSPAYLQLENDEELSFPQDVRISCEAYLADDHLILHLSVTTTITLLCSICNGPVLVPIDIKGHYSTVSLDEIPSAMYDIGAEIRETTLLHIPLFTECNVGHCPERENLEKFLKHA